jgi:uncharacterized repeat protein (TIGR03803 family)
MEDNSRRDDNAQASTATRGFTYPKGIWTEVPIPTGTPINLWRMRTNENSSAASFLFEDKSMRSAEMERGGTGNAGAVFQLKHTKTGWKEKVIHKFTGGNDGAYPEFGGVTLNSAGDV